MKRLSQETTIQEKPIKDRIRQASCITIVSALRNKVNLNISWYDVHGTEQSPKLLLNPFKSNRN